MTTDKHPQRSDATRWRPPRRVLSVLLARREFVLGLLAGVLLSAATVWVPSLFSADDRLEPGELVILSGADDGFGGQRQALVDQWNDSHGRRHGITARIEELPSSADLQYSEMKGQAQSAHSAVDIFNLDVTWVAEFAAEKWILPIPESAVDTSGFVDSVLDTCRYRGKLWALPFNTDAGLLFYRKDLVGPNLPHMTWSQIHKRMDDTLAAHSTTGPDSPRLAGYVGQLHDYEGLTVNALEMIWAAGGQVVNNDGQVVIDWPQYRDGVELGLARLADRLRVHPDAVRATEAESAQLFADGEAVFMRNWPVTYRNLTSTGGEQSPRIDFEVTRLPGPSVLGGQNLAVAASTDQPRAARELVEFLTSSRSQQLLFERGGFAATHAVVYEDEKVRQSFPYAATLRDAVASARPRPVTPHYALFSKVFRDGVREALDRDGRLPDGFARRLQAAFDGLLVEP